MSGLDVATGTESTQAGECLYQTEGPLTVRNLTSIMPPVPESMCYTWAATSMCTGNQLNALNNGSAVVENYYVVDPIA
jgi:hypothetical protein